jgi:hypothetical protein
VAQALATIVATWCPSSRQAPGAAFGQPPTQEATEGSGGSWWSFAANYDLAKIMRELLDGSLGAGSESIFADVAEAARAVLAKATIADVVDRENRAACASMYYI